MARKKVEPEKTSDHRCAFQMGGKRCPAPGTISLSLKSDRWYCRWHYQTLSDPAMAQRFLEDLLDKLPTPNDWRDDARNKRQEQFGLTQRPGETQKKLAARCRQWLREHGLLNVLPKSVQAEADREAKLEREAIQNESS